ncbi:MAG TPA: hypothetical protein VLF91_00640 [Candidatus Saccharimonadales bacterium]|nr:hypothetical protein [Candidatus Saccharimonadales bacterium]
MLIGIPLVLTSSAYALYSQQLSVHGNATEPVYTSSQNLSITYTKSITSVAGKWQYTITVTVHNNNNRNTSAWQSTFSLPSGFSNLTCSNATCTQASNVNTANNTGTNGTITANGTVVYTLVFRSTQQNYRFTSIGVSGTLVPIYAPVSGLTVAASQGTRSKSGKWYTWPFTFTVTNASGQNLAGWRILIPWNTSTNQVNSMPATVNYIETASQLTILSTQAINNGTSFQFIANLSSTSQNYVLSGYTVEGQF